MKRDTPELLAYGSVGLTISLINILPESPMKPARFAYPQTVN